MAFLSSKEAHLFAAALAAVTLVACDAAPFEAGRDRVIGGADTDIKAVPYQVALIDGLGQFCGGSIVSQDWVLTANHCVKPDDAGKIFVLAGVSKISEEDKGQKIKVAEVHKFPGFSGDPRKGKDVALIRLAKPLKLGAKVKVIEIVEETHEKVGLLEEGVVGKVSGWGVTNPAGIAGGADHLQSVEVPIISFKDAQDAYDNRLSKDQLAAALMGVGGKDACFGDSGGPYVVPNKKGDGVLLAGVVSWGQSCATPNFPGMYAKVPAFEKFIKDTMALEPQPTGTVLVINEILADAEHDANNDGEVSSSADEFIEFVNMGDAKLDLSGMTLEDASKVLLTFPDGFVLDPGQALVVFGGGEPDLNGDVLVVTAKLGLNNTGDTIKVKDTAGKVVVEVKYPSLAGSGQSIVLKNEGEPNSNFVLHTEKSEDLASPGTTANGGASFQ
jgi:hypothetical protein